MGKHILIGCTGSVATIKLPELIRQLMEFDDSLQIKIIPTNHAKHFLDLSKIPPNVQYLTNDDEWNAWQKRGDPVVHIDLGKWAHILVIAPLDANSLAKISTGICDNLLMCTARAWDLKKPLLFCPAMNTRMYEHPLTVEQITKLKSWGYQEVPTISKTLMCGDVGDGAMAEVETIVKTILDKLL